MAKKEVVNKFCKELMVEEKRKNKVTIKRISSTLIKASIDCAFVNESCKSTGEVSKSQTIYRKLEGKDIEEIQQGFRKETIKLLRALKIFSRNRRFIISFDETEEDFYGELSSVEKEDRLYLHDTKKANPTRYHYYYMTAALTSTSGERYILDAKILKRGDYKEDVVKEMLEFIKEHLPIDLVLFDRGFGWGIIKVVQELELNYIIFWKKQGKWYRKSLDHLESGGMTIVNRKKKYTRYKNGVWINSGFIITKNYEYGGKSYDWIFASNLQLENAGKYIKRYKKRWGIETIFRVNDDIRIYTTSTNHINRYFLFLFTCFVYNVWKFFQAFMGEGFTLSNFRNSMTIYLAEEGIINPIHYNNFKRIAKNISWLV